MRDKGKPSPCPCGELPVPHETVCGKPEEDDDD